MTWRDLRITVAMVAFALAVLALTLALRAVTRRRAAGKSRLWPGLMMRGTLIAALVAVGSASLVDLPQAQLVNRASTATADQTVAYVQETNYGSTANIVGVSARDGATRWTRPLAHAPLALVSAGPGMIVAAAGVDGLDALRVTDGVVLWSSAAVTPAAVWMIAADSGRIFAPTKPYSAGSSIVALDMRTGATLWSVAEPASVGMTLALAASDGLVFALGQSSDNGTQNQQWEMMALRATDGRVMWTATGANTSFAPGARLYVAGSNVLVAPLLGAVTALRMSDGAAVWSSDLTGAPDNPPQVVAASDGERFYAISWPNVWKKGPTGALVAPPVSLLALNASDGAVVWREAAPQGFTAYASLTVSDGVLFSGVSVTLDRAWAGFNPSGSLLTAMDAASGRVLWRDNTPVVGVSWSMSPQVWPEGGVGAAYLMGVQQSPFVQVCVVFCPGVAWLYAVNSRTGAPWWRVRVGDATLTHLVY